MTSTSPTICVLCGQAEGSTKVWCDAGTWQGVAHENCLETWWAFYKGRMTLAEVGRSMAPEKWRRILQRSVDGFQQITNGE
jgi:hypothetical protein